MGVAVGVLVPGVGLPLFPVVVPPFAVVVPLFPVVAPPLKVVMSELKVIVSGLVALLLVLGVALGVGLDELDELAMGGGGKPGVTVNSSKLSEFWLFCELLKLMVMVLLPWVNNAGITARLYVFQLLVPGKLIWATTELEVPEE